MKNFKILFSLLFATQASFALADGINNIKSVEIKNNQRIDTSVVKNYLTLKENSSYSLDEANNSIKALYSTGLFERVDINYNNGTLVVEVVENPLITEVLFDGNDKISDAILSSEITTSKRSVFNKNKINNDTKRILDLYRRTGRFLATVEPKIIKEDNNRIKVVFEINEGKPAKIRKINIIGAKSLNEEDLKSEISSKESKIFRFGSSEIYDPVRVEFDKELLRRFYYSKGYPNFEVLSAVGELDKDNKWFDITFLIDEGEKYKFGKLTHNVRVIKLVLTCYITEFVYKNYSLRR